MTLKLEFLHYKMISHLAPFGQEGDASRPVQVGAPVIVELEQEGIIENIAGKRRLTKKGVSIYDQRSSSTGIFIEQYGKCSSHLDKAELEQLMVSELGLSLEKVTGVLNAKYYEVRARNYILKYGPPLAWDLVDKESYALGQVQRLVHLTRKTAQREKSSDAAYMSGVFHDIYEDLKASTFQSQTTGARILRRKKPDAGPMASAGGEPEVPAAKPGKHSLVDGWKSINIILNKVIEQELNDVDAIERDKFRTDFKVETENLIRTFQMRLKRIQKLGIKLPEPNQISRGKLVKACQQLGVKAPRIGIPPDMEDAKRKFRKLAGMYHPDKNPGNNHTTELFHKVSDAYSVLMEYAEQMKGI